MSRLRHRWFQGKGLRFISGGLLSLPLLILVPAQAQAATSTSVVLNQSSKSGIPYVNGADDKAWPKIISKSAVVMDMDTGTVVYGKNPNQSHYPASITKIMTAILALQHGHLNDVLTATKEAVNQPPDKLYLVPGEKDRLEPLLYGLLLDSANDAAVDIAQHYGGSVANFAKMMNQEAKALGADHTHFVNPNGLPNPNHKTTAYDMALIARAAMQYPEFRKIVQTKYYNWHGEKWHAQLVNLNHMLFYYPGCIGLKTGFTSVAHETIVVAATRGQTTFLAVLMDTPTDAEIRQDASQLLNYAFAHYQTETVIQKGQQVGTLENTTGENIPVVSGDAIKETIPKNEYPPVYSNRLDYALPAGAVHKGEEVGQLRVTNANQVDLATIPITAGGTWSASDAQAPVMLRSWPILLSLMVLCSGLLLLATSVWRWQRKRRNPSANRALPD